MFISVEALVVLIQMACVIVVAAQVVVLSEYLRAPLLQRATIQHLIIIALLFGLLSIYGTYSGIEILGAKFNVRDLGPMIAGLIAGPFAGVGAGLIGGVHRFMMGGITAVPCSIATVLAGFIGGAIYWRYKQHFCGVKVAVIFAALMECLHMILILVLVQPFTVAIEIVQAIALPMIIANMLGMAAFSLIITDFLNREKAG